MNQGFAQDFDQVIPMTKEAALFPSLCTIQQMPGTLDTLGAQVMTFADVDGLTDIPCHSAPQSNVNLRGSSENRLKDRVDEMQQRHVLLAGYYPAIQMSMRAMIDGQPWNVIGIDNDAFSQMTRLLVQEYTV